MSLIDEALKRAREQTNPQDALKSQSGAPPAGEDPWSYAPLPDRRAPRLPSGAVAVAGGVLVLAAAAWFLLRSPRPGVAARSAGTAPARTAAPETPRTEDTARSAKIARHEESTGAAASNVGQFRETPSRDARVPGGAPPPVVLSAAIASASPATARPSPGSRSRTILPAEAGVAPERGSAPAARTHAGAFVAPDGTRIELGGIVFSETNPVALINGRVLPVGGVVGGMAIVSITENRVELAGEGARVFLSIR